jgi:hypothetical protein
MNLVDFVSVPPAPPAPAPSITHAYREFEEVDDPDRIRWRATWKRDYSTGLPVGIELTPYPVARKTPCGAWLDPLAFRELKEWTEAGARREWLLSDKRLWKFVHDRSRSAWAKPTRDEALKSLCYRLIRWSQAVRRDVERVNAACDVAGALLERPTWKAASDTYTWFTSDHTPARRMRIEVQEERP